MQRASERIERALDQADNAIERIDLVAAHERLRERYGLKRNRLVPKGAYRRGNRAGMGKRYRHEVSFTASNGSGIIVRYNDEHDMSIECDGDLDMDVMEECRDAIRSAERNQLLQDVAGEEYGMPYFDVDNRSSRAFPYNIEEGPFLFGENWKGDQTEEVTSQLIDISVGYASTRSFLCGMFLGAYPKYQAYIDFDDDGKHDTEVHMFEHEIHWQAYCGGPLESEMIDSCVLNDTLDQYFQNWNEHEIRVMTQILERVRDLGLDDPHHVHVLAALGRRAEA